MIELYCDVNTNPPPPPVQLEMERDVYALKSNLSYIFNTIQSRPTGITIYQIPNQIFEEFSITFFPVKL